jgi:hypothetical protein
MTQPIETPRLCPECKKVVYYGIYCSNVCSDKGYIKWKKARDAEKTDS